jgi:pantothenate kinase-related protein Tda10
MNNCVKFNSKYIYTEENKYIFDEFFKSPYVIAISSPYGTGKTYTSKNGFQILRKSVYHLPTVSRELFKKRIK